MAESYRKGEMILLPPYSGILFQRGEEVPQEEAEECPGN